MNTTNGNGFALLLPPELVESMVEQIAHRVAAELPAPREPYLNVQEAAEYLATKPKRIHELKEANKLPCLRDGKRLLFRREDLDEYVAGQ